jgi:hypothetical protein
MDRLSASLLGGEQHAHVVTGDMTMLAPKAKRSAETTTKLGVATTIAALWLTAVSIAGAVAAGTSGQISAARAAAIHECSLLAGRYSQHDWGNTEIYQYRACMARHGQQE